MKAFIGSIDPLSVNTNMFLISLTTALVLALALLLVYFLTRYLTQDGLEEKISPFECGFDPLRETRSPFSTRFFLLVVLFLIFDVEVALLFPIHTIT